MTHVVAVTLVVRIRHLHAPSANTPANVGVIRTTSKLLFLVVLLSLTLEIRLIGKRDSSVKRAPLAHRCFAHGWRSRMARVASAVLAVWLTIVPGQPAQASVAYALGDGVAVYACDSTTSLNTLIEAANLEDAGEAMIAIGLLVASACPVIGPFVDDLLIGEEFSNVESLIPGTSRMAVVRWQISDSDETYYTFLVQGSLSNNWFDGVDEILLFRFGAAILDEMLAE